MKSQSHRSVTDIVAAPIRAGEASRPLRVATGGDANWRFEVPSPPLARQHESTARSRPRWTKVGASSGFAKEGLLAVRRCRSFVKTTTTKTERKPNEQSGQEH